MFRTVHRHGYQPAGMTVEVITLSLTGGPHGHRNRDGGTAGDGQQFRVRYPDGTLDGTCRSIAGLSRLGIDLGDLEEVAA